MKATLAVKKGGSKGTGASGEGRRKGKEVQHTSPSSSISVFSRPSEKKTGLTSTWRCRPRRRHTRRLRGWSIVRHASVFEVVDATSRRELADGGGRRRS